MSNILKIAALVLGGFSASTAYATTQTLTFDGDDCLKKSETRQGVFTYGKPNHNLYDACEANILLGDDGWSNEDYIQVDAGYTFDLLGMDLSAEYHFGVMRGATDEESAINALINGEYDEVTAYDFVTIQGFRDGTMTTEVKFDPRITLTPDLSTFTDLTRVEFWIDAYGGNYDMWWQLAEGSWKVCTGDGSSGCTDGQSWMGCTDQFNRCGQAVYDNVRVDVRPLLPDAAPVPLPAGGVLLISAIGLVGFLRRRKSV